MRSHDEDNDVYHVTHNSTSALDNYSRLMGNLVGLPDVEPTRPTTIRHVPPFGVGGIETFTVQTYRQKNVRGKKMTESGDTIFLEHSSASGMVRLVIPPEVADAIARQREQVGKKIRSKTAKRVAKERMDAGIKPAFMKAKA